MNKYIKLIKKAKKIALFSHAGPDPDTVGSTLAMFRTLSQMGKYVDLFCEDNLPENYCFLIDSKNYNTKEFKSDEYDLLVAIDTAGPNMLGVYLEEFLKHNNTLRIDHHIKGEFNALNNIVKPYSACAILIYEIIKKLRAKIDTETATCLYFAICGDTGIFRNNNTDSLTFKIASELLNLGAEMRRVYTDFFDKKTVPYLKLTSNALLNAELNDELKYAVMTVSKADFEKFEASTDETVGNLPNTYLNCGYKVASILKEKDDGIHCSFRSKFEYDCSIIASKFGGGGHKNAAGCLIEKSLDDAKKDVIDAIKQYLTKGE